MCVPRRSKNFLLARILTGHCLQAKLPGTVIRGVHKSLNIKHNQAQRTNEWLYEYLHHKLLNYLFPASSEITCHLIITCQKSLHSVAQYKIFEIALTPDDDSGHSFGEIKLQTIQIYLNASMQGMKQIFE
jgi:hypothetical protein